MKTKKIVAIILMTLLLAPVIMGCKDEESSTKTTDSTTTIEQEEKKDSDIVEQKDNNLFELSTKEIKDIKEVLEKYGVKVDLESEKTPDSKATISEVVEDANEGLFNYSITANGNIKTTDRKNNTYFVFYNSLSTKDGKSRYEYQIYMSFSVMRNLR
jgi:hypothetical protein